MFLDANLMQSQPVDTAKHLEGKPSFEASGGACRNRSCQFTAKTLGI
jgi:hypothetical protein